MWMVTVLTISLLARIGIAMSGKQVGSGKAYLVLAASLGQPATISLADADYAFVGGFITEYGAMPWQRW